MLDPQHVINCNGDLNATINPSIIDQVIGVSPPPTELPGPLVGSVVVGERWRDSELLVALQKMVQIVFMDEVSSQVVDFYPTTTTAVVYLSEGELLSAECKRRLVKLRNKKDVKGIVIAECNKSNEGNFYQVQKFAIMDLGLTIIPVANPSEAALLMSQMVSLHGGIASNRFESTRQSIPSKELILNTIQSISGLGKTRATQLLDHFGSLHSIACASTEDLTHVLGKTKAMEVWQFFNK